jgi:hypothetical protein
MKKRTYGHLFAGTPEIDFKEELGKSNIIYINLPEKLTNGNKKVILQVVNTILEGK